MADGMVRVARRIAHGCLLLLGVSALSFALLSLSPGNFFDELRLNPQISPDTVSALRAQYGMDHPWPVRYARWIASGFRGDFGYSLSYHCPVGTLLWPRARNTLLLTGLSTMLAWMVALPLGVFEALQRGKWPGRVGSILTATLLAIPELLLALLFLLLAAKTRWLPTGGMTSPDVADAGLSGLMRDLASHLVLPMIVLALGAMPLLTRYIRSAMVTVLDSPFIVSARGHGISHSRILYKYALPAASNSLISLLGFSIGALLSTSLLVEVVLSWPGLGPLVLEALLARDIYVVMAVVMLSSVFLVLGNLIADLLLYWSDPRIRAV
jgi:peptide/nickel transport system permease protein